MAHNFLKHILALYLKIMLTLQTLFQRHKNHTPLVLSLLMAAPVIFFQSFRYSFPLGYAGMFTLIAESIAATDFVLPMNIPHYGPGGIPLVYPPLAMYIFALAMKLGIPTWAYLRLIPGILTLLSVIPLYYLTWELVKSKTASVITVVLVITAPAVYYTHVWSAGVVRAMALGLCLSGLFFYVRAIRLFSWRHAVISGVLFGVLLTTHWLYVLFAALVGMACLASEWKLNRLLMSGAILLIALLVAAPWLFIIIERHGFSSILVASSSHRNMGFIQSLQKLPSTLQFIVENLEYITYNRFFTLLTTLGLIMLLLQKKFHLPLAFVLVLPMGEASFYIEILAGMIAGILSVEAFKYFRQKNLDHSYLSNGLSFVILAVIIVSSATGLRQIISYSPELDQNSLDMAYFVKDSTDSNASYLFIGKVNEAEWFPYLLDRNPVFAPWGSEWKGNYEQQSEILTALRGCELEQDWACIENIQQEQKVSPTLLVTPNKRWLKTEIKNSHDWDLIYTNDRYHVWIRRN